MRDTACKMSMSGIKKTGFFLLCVFLTFPIKAYNLHQLSNKDGLSNSAILSICRDNERFMWIGTADGLNLYNGVNITVFKPGEKSAGNLSGNLIEEVWEGEKDIIWINTNHGLNRYNKRTRTTEHYNEFEGKYYCTKTINNEFFVVHENHIIHYYDKKNNIFKPINYSDIIMNDIRKVFIDNNDLLWIVTNKGIIHNARISFLPETPEISPVENQSEHDNPIRYAFMEKDCVYFIDYDYHLFEMNVMTGRKSLIINLKKEMEERGVVSSIIRDDDDYLIAFQTNGLLRIQNTPENTIKYQVKNIEIYCGVFCLLKDEQQDIIWIGTDGQGLYMYTRDLFSIRSITYENLLFAIQKPIRALFLDKMQNLWIGTKDDGILLISNYHIEDNMTSKEGRHITTFNSSLNNNSIYAFEKSRRNVLWIGGDGPGLNYYSYKEKRMKKAPSPAEEPILYIHNILEVNDTTLWLSSVGRGVYKVILTGTDDNPIIKSVKRYSFMKDEMSYNFFFTACRENDSILWFGNRGYGLHRLNLNNETFENILFSQSDIRTINDILSLYKDSKGNIWAGTSFGLIKVSAYDPFTKDITYVNYNEIEGLPNNTIHGIREDEKGYLWISTNGGLVRFDPETEKFHTHNRKNGLKVFEFSDGAYMKDEKTGTLFFGGINGYVSVSPDIYEKKEFIPPVFFTELRIYEKEYNINDFIHTKKGKETLQLKYDQNFFSVSFIALDYINGQNCKYYYNLENFSTKWIENGYSNHVNFTNVPPGRYILHIKCDNGDIMTDTHSLSIIILPPWYMTIWAKIAYMLLFLLLIFLVILMVRRKYKLKKEAIIENMNRQKKEEIYESKLRFFTNITHEFSTPLTLIYGPCDRIISYEKSDSFIKKYTGMIMKNTERLYSLIQELIEFRRIETGHKECIIEKLDITNISSEIVASFSELAEEKCIDYTSNIENDFYWNTDKSCFTKILINLLSNAFKYTPDNGKIALSVRNINEKLEILVHNTGKGIKEKDIPLVFDRYHVLDNFEKQTQKGFFSRNGLGLAICYNMVNLLNGEIAVRSVSNEFTEFQVEIPGGEITVMTETGVQRKDIPTLLQPIEVSLKTASLRLPELEQTKPTVFVIDDDSEMCWFISEIMNEEYNVISILDPASVSNMLEMIQPKLIISDIMMPEIDGISLMKQIKADRRTAHIPFVLLSAKNTPEEQTEGIAAGAEAYVIKPFNVEYFRSVVGRLLQRQNDLKDYFRSPISAYEFTDNKFVHKENKAFFEKIIKIIDRNMKDPDFSTEHLAQKLGLSPRHLYRKLKEITDQTPAILIKEYKLSVAEKLLVTSKYSVDEIMYMAGFNHRGSFYKLFSHKFGMTPKRYRETQINKEIK